MSVKKTKKGYKTLRANDRSSKAMTKDEFVEITGTPSPGESTEEDEGESEEKKEQVEKHSSNPDMEKQLNGSGYILVGDVFVKQMHYDVLKANIEQSGSTLLVGETGTGKTSLVSAVAREQKKELIRVSVNGSTGVEEIIGKYLASKGSTVWQDGILIRAMREGHWVIFDEINAALPEILFTLHQLLDHERKVTISEKDGEIVRPHKDFRFFANMNPPEEYAGTKELNKALLSRFDAILRIEVVPELIEIMTVVMHAEVEEKIAVPLVSMAQNLRKLKAEDKIFYFCSTRDLIQAARLVKMNIPLRTAVDHTVSNKMTFEDLQESKEVLTTTGKADITKELPSFSQLADSIKLIEKEAEKNRAEKDELEKTIERLEREAESNIVTFMEKEQRYENTVVTLQKELDTMKTNFTEKLINRLVGKT